MIRIVECGQFKLAQCDGDSAENSTATFIRGQAPVLAAELQRAMLPREPVRVRLDLAGASG